MESDQFDELIKARLERRDLCASLHESGHAMLADALNVGVERVWISGLYDSDIRPPSGVNLVAGYAVSKAIVIALAGRAVDEILRVDGHLCETSPDMYQTDECRLRECLGVASAPGTPTPEESARYFSEIHNLRNVWVASWVRQNEEPIRRFAKRLNNARVLSGEELQAALRDSWGSEKPEHAGLTEQVQASVSRFLIPPPAQTCSPLR